MAQMPRVIISLASDTYEYIMAQQEPRESVNATVRRLLKLAPGRGRGPIARIAKERALNQQIAVVSAETRDLWEKQGRCISDGGVLEQRIHGETGLPWAFCVKCDEMYPIDGIDYDSVE